MALFCGAMRKARKSPRKAGKAGNRAKEKPAQGGLVCYIMGMIAIMIKSAIRFMLFSLMAQSLLL